MPKTREEVSNEIGISRTTLWRLLKKHRIDLPSGLIYPKDEILIKTAIGFIDVSEEE